MAYSTQRAVSDGTMVYLDLAIGYQSRDDIKVFFNDLPATANQWAWVGTTDKRISFTPAIPRGVEVLIQRSTRLDRIINLFTRGAKFNNSTMDMNFEQVLFLTQEAVEGSALSDIYNDVDFHNYKIKNLGVATDRTDAITFGQVQDMVPGVWTARDQAVAAQVAAQAARDKAQQWATQLTTPVEGTDLSAKQYALNSKGSQDAAAASASQSGTSAVASQQSRVASEAARDRSEAARDRAEAAAAPATDLINRVTAAEANSTAAVTAANAALPKSGGVMTGPITLGAGGMLARSPVVAPGAGEIGELRTQTADAEVGWSNAVFAAATSLALTAGVWDVTASMSVRMNGSTTTVNKVVGVSTVVNNVDPMEYTQSTSTDTGGLFLSPTRRYVVATGQTTTVYCICYSAFTGGPGQFVRGRIQARRIA